MSEWPNDSWENNVPHTEQLHGFNYRDCMWMLTPVYASKPKHRHRGSLQHQWHWINIGLAVATNITKLMHSIYMLLNIYIYFKEKTSIFVNNSEFTYVQ